MNEKKNCPWTEKVITKSKAGSGSYVTFTIAYQSTQWINRQISSNKQVNSGLIPNFQVDQVVCRVGKRLDEVMQITSFRSIRTKFLKKVKTLLAYSGLWML